MSESEGSALPCCYIMSARGRGMSDICLAEPACTQCTFCPQVVHACLACVPTFYCPVSYCLPCPLSAEPQGTQRYKWERIELLSASIEISTFNLGLCLSGPLPALSPFLAVPELQLSAHKPSLYMYTLGIRSLPLQMPLPVAPDFDRGFHF